MHMPMERPARIAYENLRPLQNLRECAVDRSMRVQDGNQVFDRNEAQIPGRKPRSIRPPFAVGSRLKRPLRFVLRKKHFDNFQSPSDQMLATQGAGKRSEDDENTILQFRRLVRPRRTTACLLPIRHGV